VEGSTLYTPLQSKKEKHLRVLEALAKNIDLTKIPISLSNCE